jgi:type IV secretory pathway TrbF-like protein
MAMTKKDFEAIAAKVAEVRSEYVENARVAYHDGEHVHRRSLESAVMGMDVAVTRISEALAASNPRFDRLKFLQACGVR